MGRTAEIRRETRKTNIVVRLDLDGSGKADVKTGIGFYDYSNGPRNKVPTDKK